MASYITQIEVRQLSNGLLSYSKEVRLLPDGLLPIEVRVLPDGLLPIEVRVLPDGLLPIEVRVLPDGLLL